jgi:hypothetical protein
VKYIYFTLPFFITGATDQTTEWIFTHSSSNNTVLPKEVFFGVSLNEAFIRNFSFLPSGLVEGTFMLAWFGVGLKGFPGSAFV